MLDHSFSKRLVVGSLVLLSLHFLLDVSTASAADVPAEANAVEANAGKSDAGKSDAGKSDAGKSDAGKSDAGDLGVTQSNAIQSNPASPDTAPSSSAPPNTAPPNTASPNIAPPNIAQSANTQLSAGDTAWILIATGLVLFMTIPALAMFYGGLVRTKSVLSILMQCLVLTALMSVLWVVVGYSLAFDDTGMRANTINLHSFIGGFGKVMMKGVTPGVLHGTIPEILFAAFQMTFAVITPALIIGAFAERMKFSAVLIFSALWMLAVYCPICHMTWAGAGGVYSDWGVKDFAGGIVVHITAGFAALVACIMIGPRAGYPRHLEPPHNLTMTLTGTAMLWVGWFGFNGGSQLAADGTAAMAVFVTHLSASVATLVWMAIEWIKLGKPSVLGAATGAVAGLAAVTPASGYIGPVGAIAIGTCSALLCFVFATVIKQRFRYDDTLDVFGVHGVGGFLGTILCGVFAAKAFGGVGVDHGIASELKYQLMAAVSCAVYTVVATYIILKCIQLTIGIRVDGAAEDRGLDLAEHEERGYIL